MPGRRAALSVDDMVSWASASLHHEKCRPSRWNDDAVVPMSPDSTLSHRTMCILLPLIIGDATEPDLKPFLLVNPGLEQVFLDRGPLGQWKVIPNAAFTDAGLKPPPAAMESPVTGVSAELRADTLTVAFTPGMVGHYASSLTEQARSVQDEGGLMLAVTHAIDPHNVARDVDLEPVLRGDRTVMGWVKLGPHTH